MASETNRLVTDPELQSMNEAQLLFQSYSLIEKQKREDVKELSKFLFVRENIIEALGLHVEAEPSSIELHGVKFKKSHALPLIYLSAPIFGGEPISSLFKGYSKSLAERYEAKEISKNDEEEFHSVYQLIKDGYEVDDILKEMCGNSVDELISNKRKEIEELELNNLTVNKEKLDKTREDIMNEEPKHKKKKEISFNIKMGE